MVRGVGLEPTHRKIPDPKSGASANFATRALISYTEKQYNLILIFQT